MRQKVLLRIASGVDPTGGRKLLLDMWNVMNPDCRAEFTPVVGPPPDQRQGMEDHAKNNTAELLNLDVIHVAQFAANGWIVPLSPQNPSGFLKPLSRTCRKRGDDDTYFAVPFNTDCGVLFHRTQIGGPVDEAPSLPDLHTLLTPTGPDRERRWIAQLPVRSSAFGEAFVCNVIEHALARNPSIVGKDGKPSYEPNAWSAALEPLQQAIGSRRVVGVAEGSTEETSVAEFKAGKAHIMRNWPVRFGELETVRRESGQPWRLQVGSLPHSVLGGQNLAVVSGSPFQAEAAALVDFLTDLPAQRVLAAYGFVPTRRETYNDKELRSFVPHLDKLRGIVEEARPRPVTMDYERFSDAIQKYARDFVFGERDFTEEFTTEVRKSIEG